MSETLKSAMQAVIDKQEIYDVLARLCRAVDRSDRALLETTYHADGMHKHGTAPEMTAAQYIDIAISSLSQVGSVYHQLQNVLIELHGDVAYAESYVTVFHRLEKDGEPFDCIIGARELDRFEKRGSEWRIAHGQVIFDWNQDIPACESWARGLFPGAGPEGAKDGSDPSYQMIGDGPGKGKSLCFERN